MLRLLRHGPRGCPRAATPVPPGAASRPPAVPQSSTMTPASCGLFPRIRPDRPTDRLSRDLGAGGRSHVSPLEGARVGPLRSSVRRNHFEDSLRRVSNDVCPLGHWGILSPLVTWTFSSQWAQEKSPVFWARSPALAA